MPVTQLIVELLVCLLVLLRAELQIPAGDRLRRELATLILLQLSCNILIGVTRLLQVIDTLVDVLVDLDPNSSGMLGCAFVASLFGTLGTLRSG